MKNAEPPTPPVAPRRARQVWSITRRLTLLYVTSTAALLLLAGGFLYWSLDRNLKTARKERLASKIEVMRLLLRDQPEKTDILANEVEHEASASPVFKYYIRILDERGRVLLESSGMKDLLPPSLFPAPAGVAEPPNGVERKLPPRRSFVLLSAQALAGGAGGATRTVQIAHDISVRISLLADYRRQLLLVLGLGLVFAGGTSVWVAREGMRPLAEIAKVAEHITASRLDERISGSRWPAELAGLAAVLDAMLHRLEEAFTRLSQFSDDLAHELRTPINNLRGEAEVALTRSRAPEDYQQLLASSLEEYDRLSRMIDGLLFLARADNPKAALERVRFDARKEIEAVIEFYEALAGEREVEMACEGQGWVKGDPALFRRAIGNLLANALHHTPARGSVCIALHPLDDQTLELSIRDTGAGIAPEHLSKIFDRFYRIPRSPSGSPAGTGLGLAIVRSIMRLHAGDIRVHSVLGQGATFTLVFPS
ncbi:MAG: heavy metal sensor histidine kinase [Lentisphaerae bacterium]|nr:heavy metal sensor histidine kinase [Lentisphaerota bacterium]